MIHCYYVIKADDDYSLELVDWIFNNIEDCKKYILEKGDLTHKYHVVQTIELVRIKPVVLELERLK